MIRTGARVARITVDDDAVTGVVLDGGEEVRAPVVISTTDPASTLLGLVDPVWLDPDLLRDVQNIKFRASTALVHFAVDRLPNIDDAALASVISFSPQLDGIERAYDAAKYGQSSAEPHVELTAPTVRWPSLAPAGKHIVSAHAQYITRGDTSDIGERVMGVIERAIPGFADTVLHRAVVAPLDIERRLGLTGGALTHGELTLDQILFMRPASELGRYRTPIAGLYLGGSGSHPGPGVVGGAGWLAARAALSAKTMVPS